MTFAPDLINLSDIAYPNPCAPPVTIATLSVKSKFKIFFFSFN